MKIVAVNRSLIEKKTLLLVAMSLIFSACSSITDSKTASLPESTAKAPTTQIADPLDSKIIDQIINAAEGTYRSQVNPPADYKIEEMFSSINVDSSYGSDQTNITYSLVFFHYITKGDQTGAGMQLDMPGERLISVTYPTMAVNSQPCLYQSTGSTNCQSPGNNNLLYKDAVENLDTSVPFHTITTWLNNIRSNTANSFCGPLELSNITSSITGPNTHSSNASWGWQIFCSTGIYSKDATTGKEDVVGGAPTNDPNSVVPDHNAPVSPSTQSSSTINGGANPASVACVNAGGIDQIINTSSGQIGLCALGSAQIEEWTLARGASTLAAQAYLKAPDASVQIGSGGANPAAIYCTLVGGHDQIITTNAGQDGICIFADNSTIEDETLFAGAQAAGNAKLTATLKNTP